MSQDNGGRPVRCCSTGPFSILATCTGVYTDDLTEPFLDLGPALRLPLEGLRFVVPSSRARAKGATIHRLRRCVAAWASLTSNHPRLADLAISAGRFEVRPLHPRARAFPVASADAVGSPPPLPNGASPIPHLPGLEEKAASLPKGVERLSKALEGFRKEYERDHLDLPSFEESPVGLTVSGLSYSRAKTTYMAQPSMVMVKVTFGLLS
jgi:hypothetical protein